MYYLIGLFVALVSITASIIHLGQSAGHYFDFVAFIMVIGGTTAVAIIIFPWEHSKELFANLKKLIANNKFSHQDLLHECIQLINDIKENNFSTDITSKNLPGRILLEGRELISLGLDTKKIEMILRERVFQASLRAKRVANNVRSLAKYPPAFGLAGTVLGLVSLMKAISDGAAVSETGVRMAIALVATFYGLLVSNLIINPAGENILKTATEEEASAEIAIQTIVLAAERTSILESQEVLNSFVRENDKVNVIAQNFNNLRGAA